MTLSIEQRIVRLEQMFAGFNPGGVRPKPLISADLIIAGTLQAELVLSGEIRDGQTAYDTGTGFWLGTDSGTPKLSVGDSTANKITWDGTTLSVVGCITVASLASAVTDRMFDSSALSDNVQAWPHASDVTKIDGGDIYAGSVTASQITVTSLSALNADMGTLNAGTINMFTGTWDDDATGFRLNADEIEGQLSGVTQANWAAATGKITAGAVTLDVDGITLGASTTYVAGNAVEWYKSGDGTYPLKLWGGYGVATDDNEALILGSGGAANCTVRIQATQGAGKQTYMELISNSGTSSVVNFYVNVTKQATLDSSGHLSTFGYIYPGTGSAIQSTRYIKDDGSQQLVISTTNASRGLEIESDQEGVGGAGLALYHNTESLAVGDDIASLVAWTRDTHANKNKIYAGQIALTVLDNTDGSEDFRWEFHVLVNGADTIIGYIDAAGFHNGAP